MTEEEGVGNIICVIIGIIIGIGITGFVALTGGYCG